MAEFNKGNPGGQPNQGTQNPQNTSGGNMSDEDRRRQAAGGSTTQSQGDKNVAGRTDNSGHPSPDKNNPQGTPDKNRPGQSGDQGVRGH